jgi:hypothetical protein
MNFTDELKTRARYLKKELATIIDKNDITCIGRNEMNDWIVYLRTKDALKTKGLPLTWMDNATFYRFMGEMEILA